MGCAPTMVADIVERLAARPDRTSVSCRSPGAQGHAGIVRRVSDRDGELAELQAECERLRADLDRTEAAVRAAEHEAGTLRGAIAEMQVQLVRARQDQERYQRWLSATHRVHERLAGVKHRVVGRRR